MHIPTPVQRILPLPCKRVALADASGSAQSLTSKLPGERLDRGASALREASHLVRVKKTEVVDHNELAYHAAASRIVEGIRELIVPFSQEAEDTEVPLVVSW